MKKLIIIIIFLFIVCFAYSKEKIRLQKIPANLNIISANILKEAYEKIDIEVEFIELPPARGVLYSNDGHLDGEVQRIKGIDEKYTNLIFISVPINYFELRIVSKNHNFYIENKDQLKNYTIGATRGIILFEEYLKGLNSSLSNGTIGPFKMLEKERVDLVLTDDVEGRIMIKNHFPNFILLEPPLKKIYLYHYLHKSKAHLVPKITKTLEEMKRNGRFKEIRDEYIESLIN